MSFSATYVKEVRKVWAHKWIVLIAALIFSLSGWTYIFLIPDNYKSMARVYLDSQSILGPLLKGLAVDSNERQRSVAQMARKTLLSRPNLEQVIRETDQDLLVKTPEDYERLLDEVIKNVEVEGEGGRQENIYIISYQDPDPLVAKKVVSSLLSIFMENALGTTRSDTGMTEKFLDDQIAEYLIKLEVAEERLKDFKRSNIGMMPTEAGGHFSRLQKSQEELAQADLELLEEQKRHDELKKQIDNVISGVSSGEEKTSVDNRIQMLEVRLDDLRLQFTEQHPDIQSIKKTISLLKNQGEETGQERTLSEHASDNSFATTSPVYQELMVSLGEAAAEVSALSARKAEYENRVGSLRKMVETVPEVEAELLKLTRTYEITKKNYESLFGRKESAKISRAAELSAEMFQFRIIDPPVVPVFPVNIRKPYLFTMALLFALAGGCALSWSLSTIKNAFIDANELRKSVSFPVLGAVSEVLTEDQLTKKRIGMAIYVVIFGCLISVYGLIMATQISDINIFILYGKVFGIV